MTLLDRLAARRGWNEEERLVLDQVLHGVAVRMAVLFRLLGGEIEDE